MRTDLHDSRDTEKEMRTVKTYENGYKIVRWPERKYQPYTLWKGDSVIYFFETLEEAESRIFGVNNGKT